MNILSGPLNDEPVAKVGWSSIVASSSGEFSLAGSERLGFWEWLFGKRHFYQVHIAPHRLEYRFDLDSGQSTYRFKAAVTATAQIRDALAAVQQGLRNTSEALRQPIEEALQEAVRSADFRDTQTAWSNGLAALRQLKHPLIQLSEIVLKIEPDSDAIKDLRTVEGQKLRIAAWTAQSEVKKLESDQLLETFGSLDKMLARLIVEDNPEMRASLKEAIALKMQQNDRFTQLELDAFKIAVESGHLEDFEVPKILMKLVEKMARTSGGSLPSVPLLGGDAPPEGDDAPKPDGKPDGAPGGP